MDFHLIKLKEPGLLRRLFQLLLLRRRREITVSYEANFISCLQKLLDACPTSPTRLGNVYYEPFLSKTTHYYFYKTKRTPRFYKGPRSPFMKWARHDSYLRRKSKTAAGRAKMAEITKKGLYMRRSSIKK
jgi:hypothetical protein